MGVGEYPRSRKLTYDNDSTINYAGRRAEFRRAPVHHSRPTLMTDPTYTACGCGPTRDDDAGVERQPFLGQESRAGEQRHDRRLSRRSASCRIAVHSADPTDGPPTGPPNDAVHSVAFGGALDPSPLRRVYPALRSIATAPKSWLEITSIDTSVVPVPVPSARDRSETSPSADGEIAEHRRVVEQSPLHADARIAESRADRRAAGAEPKTPSCA